MDAATYLGPIEVQGSDGKGRGLFATRDVKAGELLLCEKAFALVHGFTDAKNGHGGIDLDEDQLQIFRIFLQDIE